MANHVATPGEVLALTMQEAQRRGMEWFQPFHASGMVGSFMQETGDFRADVINFERKGDDGTAHGLMQWRGDRYNNLINYARQTNQDPTDIRTQISFAFEEGDSSSPFADYGSVRAFREFKSANNAKETALSFVHAERSAGYDGNPANAHDAVARMNHAARALGQYTGDEDLERLGANGQFVEGNYGERDVNDYGARDGELLNGMQSRAPISQMMLQARDQVGQGFGLPQSPINNNVQRPASSRVPEDARTIQTYQPQTTGSELKFNFGLPTDTMFEPRRDLSFGLDSPEYTPYTGNNLTYGQNNSNSNLTNTNNFGNLSFGTKV